ncbi:sensor histidine kinase [Corynebacterium terpenotabidum]|uniref:histidine kinase n=1 Tax=Corynebacterium terpenotabidum Y-11 TaxID=1200352 RepID=S4XEU6_9CORY|nr:HAMP domain-containing sensor histidine kinase [Corynebacterium terpenotabidum]AGP30135.1 two-component system sensor kinase [Corynebacterium terpenotabidum Y-11]
MAITKDSTKDSSKDSTRRRYPGVFLSHFPLRVSLVLVMTALAALGLAVSGAVVTGMMQQFLTNRVDEQLISATREWASGPADSSQLSGNGLSDSGSDLQDSEAQAGPMTPPSQFYVAIMSSDGEWSFRYNPQSGQSAPDISSLTEVTSPVTVSAVSGSEESTPWRAAAVLNDSGQVVVVALPMDGEYHIMTQLLVVLVTIGVIVLILLVVGSLYLVRRALQPLYLVERTAGRIAKGQLDERVPEWSPNTEVGRLSVALNRMLAQIQGAFIAVNTSERQAREAEASMRRFIGDASHELRTPLTSVRGYADLYKSGATTDADMVVDRISSEAGRMSLLVEDLLTLVRMDEGRPLRTDPVDLMDLSVAAVDNARAGFPGREVRLVNETRSIPVTIGDANRLHQIIGNLMTNALRHGGEDARVTLKLTQSEPGAETPMVGVDVIDDGVGIPAEDLPHLFERFYRADVSRARSSGGSGLGLSIVKSLVEAHGGTITVESAPGEGTTFHLCLPAAPEMLDESDIEELDD